MLYYVSNTLDPTYNIATEYYLFHKYDKPVFYLWINGPSIVVGKHQNTIEEINTKFVKENNIQVCRRVSGGGAVYHDQGNLNYTIISNDEQWKIDYNTFSRPIIHALKKMGVYASTDDRNSIRVDDFKICGHAQYKSKSRTMHHGCLLFDSDLTVLGKALKVSKDKIKSKGIKSVRSQVKNISEFLEKDYTMLDFKTFIKESIEDEYGKIEAIELTEKDHTSIESLRNEKFTGWEWVYGESPPFKLKRKRILSEGDFEVRLAIKHGLIEDIHFYGDFFGVSGVEEVEKVLVNLRYEKEILSMALEAIDVEPVFQISMEDFLELIID